MKQIHDLDIGTRFGWRNSVWKVRTRGLTYVEAQDEQFSTFQMFTKNPAYGEPSWRTEVQVIGESIEENQPWTPRELIESLSKWRPDQPIDVALTNNPANSFGVEVTLVQNTNAILLTKGRT
jgi:hypothetical protein